MATTAGTAETTTEGAAGPADAPTSGAPAMGGARPPKGARGTEPRAETVGFEPTEGVTPFTALAGPRTRPDYATSPGVGKGTGRPHRPAKELRRDPSPAVRDHSGHDDDVAWLTSRMPTRGR